MKNIKISFLLDALFLFVAVFFVFYAIVKSIVKGILPATIITIFICLVITSLYTALSIKKHGKKVVIDGEEKLYKAFMKTLYITPDKEILELIKSYYEKLGNEAVKTAGRIKLKAKKQEVFFNFTPDCATLKEVLSAYKRLTKGYNLVFIANDYEVNVLSYFNGFGERVTLINSKAFFTALKKENLLPEINVNAEIKPTIRERFSTLIKRERAPAFLAWGGVTLLFSTVSYYKAIYVIIGGAFICFSLFLRFFAPSTNAKLN